MPNTLRLKKFLARRPNQLALSATLLWALISLAYGLGYGGAGIGRGYVGTMLLIITFIVPIALFWIIARLSQQSTPLHFPHVSTADEIDSMLRNALTPIEPRFDAFDKSQTDLAKQMRSVAESMAVIAIRLNANRPTAPVQSLPPTNEPESFPEQDQLPLVSTQAQSAIGPTIADIIRAANFPNNDSDFETVNAIKQALKNRKMAQLLQAAEDILNLLAQDGIYMDDLHVAPLSPAQWRAFAQGKRGAEVASVGAIHDQAALAKTRARSRKDQVYRDTALHFQRRFDVILGDFARNASDAEILSLANTRTGRAFMLMARVSGTFD